MTKRDERQLWGGFWVTSLGTLASRVLGVARDVATASILGLGEGGVMDALVIALRVANLPRRIFGEGALAAGFLPVFTAEYELHPRRAWQLTSALVVWLAVLLSAVVVLGEMVCAALWRIGGSRAEMSQLVGLSAVLLPYMIWVCLAAQVSAALQGLLEFRVPAAAPSLLNVCWLAAALIVAPWFAPDKLAQAYVIAVAILVSGVLQLIVPWWALAREGFRFEYDWSASRQAVGQVGRAALPIALGMAVTQLNTLVDSLIAWSLSAEAGGSPTIGWLSDAVAYPMQSGAAAAIYYGERFYQLPVGLLGTAIATVIYPLLSRHAARGDRRQLAADLTLGLRLVWFTALPAGIGIILVAEPMTRVLFERGAFTADDAARSARMIACYASGVWAYCAIPVLVRGFYAVGDRATPARLGLVSVALNLALNLTLVWPLAEQGLAVATAISAAVQVVLLAVVFSRRAGRLSWTALTHSLVRGSISALVMSAAVLAVTLLAPIDADASRTRQALSLGCEIAAGVVAYLSAAATLRMPELKLLLGRS